MIPLSFFWEFHLVFFPDKFYIDRTLPIWEAVKVALEVYYRVVGAGHI